MTNAKYSFQGMTESMAKAMKRDVELSLKVAIEMSSFLKGKTTSEAKTILERVLSMKQAIPYKRFQDGVGHRKGKGIVAGRYPQKGSAIFIELIKSVEANAQTKGLSSDLKIIHLAPQKSSGAFHSGRQGRRKFKRSHLEIVVQEVEKDSKDNSKKNPSKKQNPKTEEKKEERKEEHKKTEIKEHKQENKDIELKSSAPVEKEEINESTSKETTTEETAPKIKKKRAVKKVKEQIEEETQEDKQ
jgi:large subunit ribosomal protein L22